MRTARTGVGARHALAVGLLLAGAAPILADAGACAAIFDGPNCKATKMAKNKCVDGAFKGGWLTLHKTVVGKGDKRMWHVGANNAAAAVTKRVASDLPAKDAFGRSWSGDSSEGGLGPARFASCALVSNSPKLKGRGLGKDIDSNEVVVRMNNAPTKRHEKDVGKKTSLRFTNDAYQGFREGRNEAVIAKWRNERGGARHKLLSRMLLKKAHPVNPAFMRYAENGMKRAFKEVPTSGFVMLLMLAHVCAKVKGYGFQGTNLKSWYWPKRKAFGGKAPVRAFSRASSPPQAKGAQTHATPQPSPLSQPKGSLLRNKIWTVSRWSTVKAKPVSSPPPKVASSLPPDAAPTPDIRAASLDLGSDDAPAERRGRVLLHAIRGERTCMTSLVKGGVVALK